MMNDNEIPFGNDNNAETENNARGKDRKSSHANSANYSNESKDTTPPNNDSLGNRFYDSQRDRTYSTQYPHDGQYNQRQGNYRQNNYNREGQQQGNYRQNNYNREGQQQGNYRQNNYNREGQQQGNYRQNNYNREGQQGNYRQNNYNRDGQQGNYRQNNYNREGQQQGNYRQNNYNRDGQQQGNYRQNNYNRDGQQQGNYRQNNYNRDGQQQGNYRQNNYNRDGQQGNYRQNNYNRDGQQQGNYRQNNYNRDGQQQGNYRQNNYNRDGQQFRHRGNNFQRNNPRNRPAAHSPRFKGRPKQNKKPQPQRPRLTPLVKILRTIGFASPRICVEIIRSGRVFVNGNIFNNPNASVNAKRDSIAIDGLNINERNQNLYIIINKQKNIVGSNENTHNSIYNQVKTNAKLYFPFGCLERATSGLVFATTDSNFRLPDNPLCASTPIEYKIKVQKTLTKRQVSGLSTKFRTRTSSDNAIEYIGEYKRHSWIKCKVINTKPTIIRKVLKEIGLEVLSFERFAIGSLTTDVLQRGMWTRLTSDNVKKMLREPLQAITIEEISQDENNENTDITLRQKVRSLYRHWFMK
jgi:16S rRNA U516 pseudouridylate synthase RsuA-like enzyme